MCNTWNRQSSLSWTIWQTIYQSLVLCFFKNFSMSSFCSSFLEAWVHLQEYHLRQFLPFEFPESDFRSEDDWNGYSIFVVFNFSHLATIHPNSCRLKCSAWTVFGHCSPLIKILAISSTLIFLLPQALFFFLILFLYWWMHFSSLRCCL